MRVVENTSCLHLSIKLADRPLLSNLSWFQVTYLVSRESLPPSNLTFVIVCPSAQVEPRVPHEPAIGITLFNPTRTLPHLQTTTAFGLEKK